MQPAPGESAALADVLQDGDVLLTQGAGNIGALAKQLAAQQLQISLLKAGLKAGAKDEQ